MHTKFEVHSFTHSCDNRGYSKNLGSPTLPLLHYFNGILLGWTPHRPNLFEVRSFTRSWDNSDWRFWVGVANPQSWGKGGRRGSGIVPFERALASSYRLSSIFTRFRDIAAFVLQLATFSHPTSSLPQISPGSPGSRWMAFGLRRAKALG